MAQYIYGKNTVMERLKQQGVIHTLYLVNELPQFVALAHKKHIAIKWINSELADKMVKGNHQGVIALVKEYEPIHLDDLLRQCQTKVNPIVVMCDHLEDPHNLGAILRTCDATGVAGVIINKHRSVSLNATVAKVSTGAIETVPVVIETNLVQAVKKLKQHGFWIVAADNDESIDYRQIPTDRPLVLIVGSEGKGISHLLKKEADYRVAIFMKGTVNSLNVSVASGVLLYHIVSAREPLK